MEFIDIAPYVRYARTLHIDGNFSQSSVIPYDARLFYTCAGQGTIEVNKKSYFMTKGTMLVINSGVGYRIKAPENYVKYLALNFDFTQSAGKINIPIPPDIPSLFNFSNIIDHVQFEDMPEFNTCVYSTEQPAVQNTLVKIIYEYKNRLINYNLKMSCLLSEVLIECTRHLLFNRISKSSTVNDILSYISENYRFAVTNKELADKFHLNPNYISRIVKKCVGMPLHQYVLHLRIMLAMEMLESTTLNVNEIAAYCGFCDVYYFSRYFKAITGMPPSNYKGRQHISKHQ